MKEREMGESDNHKETFTAETKHFYKGFRFEKTSVYHASLDDLSKKYLVFSDLRGGWRRWEREALIDHCRLSVTTCNSKDGARGITTRKSDGGSFAMRRQRRQSPSASLSPSS